MSVMEAHSAVRPRYILFYALVAMLVAVLFTGLAYRQLFSSEAFLERERIQSQRRILIPGPRGEIYDREGRVLVANRPRFSAVLYFSDARLRREFREEYIRLVREAREKAEESGANDESARPPPNPLRALDERARANVVQRYLDVCDRVLGRHETIASEVIERHLSQQPLLPFPLIADLAPTEFGKLIEQLPTSSPIQILPSTMRHYPYGSASSHVLGFVSSTLDLSTEGLEGADLKSFFGRGSLGRDGLERQFDGTLQGKTGSEIWIVDPAGFQVRMVDNTLPVSGQPMYSSLDIDLQLAGEAAFGDKEGALVAIDVNTGEILALVSRPDYDLNTLSPSISRETFRDIEERGAWSNRAIQGLYPPGSLFKIVNAVAALRAGAITPEVEVECSGYLQVAGRKFPCSRHSGHGMVDLRRAIALSCNVFFYKSALDTGADQLAEQARRFGLDRPTGIELPGETQRMLVPDRAWKQSHIGEPWFPGDTANMAIGQGYLDVTPLQMACFTASLARGETLTRPTIMRRNPGIGGIASANQTLGLSPSDRAAILEGMEQAIQVGTGRLAKIPGVRLAGKTGTAQKRTPRGTLELAWFLGFGPIENPSIAIALVVVGDQPDEANAGGLVAAPVARQVLEVYFRKHPPPGAAAAAAAGT